MVHQADPHEHRSKEECLTLEKKEKRFLLEIRLTNLQHRNWLKHCQICIAQPWLFVPNRDYLFFFEYIRKIRSLRTRLVTLNCILSQRDRRRSSRERGLQASPRPFLGLFFGLFIFLSFDTTPCPESGPRASSPL